MNRIPVLRNFAARKAGRIPSCVPENDDDAPGITEMDRTMRSLGLWPGLHIRALKELRMPELKRKRVAAGPKYIVLHGGDSTLQSSINSRWGAYNLVAAFVDFRDGRGERLHVRKNILPVQRWMLGIPFHRKAIYLQEEFVAENSM